MGERPERTRTGRPETRHANPADAPDRPRAAGRPAAPPAVLGPVAAGPGDHRLVTPRPDETRPVTTPPPNVKAVFDRAAEIDAPADRGAYLAEACAGFPDVRREVED